MMIIGLTGNIATGKSTVMRLAQARGALTIDADKIGHELLLTDGVKSALRHTFGDAIFDERGEVVRPALGRIVFADSQAMQQLEAITHPAVRERIAQQIGAATETVIIIEAIKLLEGALKSYCDQIWVTTCSAETQLDRLISHRQMSPLDAQRRISAQAPQAEKVRRADVVINTEGSYEETVEQFNKAWEKVIQ